MDLWQVNDRDKMDLWQVNDRDKMDLQQVNDRERPQKGRKDNYINLTNIQFRESALEMQQICYDMNEPMLYHKAMRFRGNTQKYLKS